MRLFLAIVTLLIGLTEIAHACGTEWTFLSSPPYVVLCIQGLPDNGDDFLAGTWRGPNTPESGGVFRYMGQDTTWELVGLSGHRVHALERPGNIPVSLFAATSEGLFRTGDEGGSWQLVTEYGTGLSLEQTCFAVSPFDTNEWVVGSGSIDGGGVVVATSDAGRTWRYRQIFGYVGNLGFSRYTPGRVFEAVESAFAQFTADDSAQMEVLLFMDDTVMGMIQHPIQPWWYIISPDTIVRYDEAAGQFIGSSLPSGSYGHTSSIRYAEGYGPVIGTYGGIFYCDDNLSNWRLVEMPESTQVAAAIYFCSEQAWVAGYRSGFYCHSAISSAGEGRMHHSDTDLRVYPNPVIGVADIEYVLPTPVREIKLRIFNLLGQCVATLADGPGNAGHYGVKFDGSALSSGVYFYRLEAGNFVAQKKMVLLK